MRASHPFVQRSEAHLLARMAERWGQPPSHWLPHLHPLQAYHLDQALFIQSIHLDAQRAREVEAAADAPRPSGSGPVNQMRLPTAAQQARLDALKARAAAGQTTVRRSTL